jgi:cytochrome c oxidase subunit 3/cytochrome o ubiquinol oxidase subunit 3
MSTIPLEHAGIDRGWSLPSRGAVGIGALIVGESAMFAIFVVAYIYYIGRSTFGPTPREVLDVPVIATICLLSSSLSIWAAEREIHRGRIRRFQVLWAITCLLGAVFLFYTATEWNRLIFHDGLTVRTNLFGTTFYSLVGLHAAHVVAGLTMLLLVLLLSLLQKVGPEHTYRLRVLSIYWHFVDAVWVVVFTVVYVVGR